MGPLLCLVVVFQSKLAEMLVSLLFWLLIPNVVADADGKTISIWDQTEFLVQPVCAMYCLENNNYGTLGLVNYFGCISPFYNQCYCNPDRASSATSYISSCVASRCTGAALASTAVAVFSSYCSSAGYNFAQGNVAIATSTEGTPGQTGSAVTRTTLSIVTATTNGPSPTNSARELAPSLLAALLNALLALILC